MDFTKLSYQQILNCASVLNTCAINMDMILNVELRDLLDKIGDENFWSGTSAQRLKEELDSLVRKSGSNAKKNKNIDEAKTALEVLGYSKSELNEVIEKIKITDEKVEDIIRIILKEMQK